MVALGMTPMNAIMTSTSAAARLLRLSEHIGTIEVGKQADLLFVEGNFENDRRVDETGADCGVMQGGRFVAGPLSQM